MKYSGFIPSMLAFATSSVFVIVPRPAMAAPPVSSAALPGDGINVEVTVASTIDGQERLRGWLESKTRSVLAESEYSGKIGTLSVEVTGGLYDYQVTVTTSRNGEFLGEAENWNCECSNEELLGMMSSKVPPLASRLEVQSTEEMAVKKPQHRATERAPEQDLGDIEDRSSARPSPRSVGAVGITMLTLGAVGIAGGIPMVAIHKRIGRPSESWTDRNEIDLRPPGLGIASAGAGLLVVGSILYAVHRRKNRRADTAARTTVTPSIGASSAFTLTLNRKF